MEKNSEHFMGGASRQEEIQSQNSRSQTLTQKAARVRSFQGISWTDKLTMTGLIKLQQIVREFGQLLKETRIQYSV